MNDDRNSVKPKESNNQWNIDDFRTIFICLGLIIIFSLRVGTTEYMIKEFLKQLWAYSIYSIGTVLIIIGLTKRIFKYEPSMKQIIKWSFMLGAFCAVSQFFHELFMWFSK